MYPIKTSAPYNPDFLPKLGNIYTTPYLGNYVAGVYEEGSGSHPGVDVMPMTPNDELYAVLAGTIHKAGNNPSEGNFVIIRHDNVKDAVTGTVATYYSCYLHMSEISVAAGQAVAEGDVIGKTGNTGQSTGEHLHFQIDRADAPFHPYWPFSFKEARDLGMGFMEAVNKGLGIDNAKKYTVNPLVFLEQATVVGTPAKPTVGTPVVPTPVAVVTPPVTPTVTVTPSDKQIAGTVSAGQAFSDVPSTNRYATAIAYLRDQGIATGQSGKFSPKMNVSRGELLKMALLAADMEISNDLGSHFSDMPAGSPFLPYVNTAVALKAVSGFADGTFKPNNPVTRAEGLKIVLGILAVDLEVVDGPVYADVGKKDWFAPHALWNRDHEILLPSGANLLPNEPMTREEVAGIIYGAVNS